MKLTNLQLILNTLRKYGPVSRSDLAQHLDFTSPAITNIISSLLQKGVIVEKGTLNTTSGRKPVLIDLNPDCSYVIGIFFTTESYSVTLSDFQSHILTRISEPLDRSFSQDELLQMLLAGVSSCLRQHPVERSKILGVGVCCPGPVDVERGVIVNPPNCPALNHFAICQALEDALGIPAVLDKETNAAALAEYYFSDTKQRRSMFYLLLLKKAIGGSLLHDGAVFHGFRDSAGEIGHMLISPNGPLCSCGQYGCLECMASGGAIMNRVQETLKSFSNLQAELPCSPEKINLRDIFRLADKHVQPFAGIVDEAARNIATALGNVVCLNSPSQIVIGGPIAEMSPAFVQRIADYLHHRRYPAHLKDIDVIPSDLKDLGCDYGAIILALNAFQTSIC